MNKLTVKLGEHSFVTKLAGFEHSKYFQHNATHHVNEIPLIQGKNIRDGKVIYSFDWYISKAISDALPRSVLNKRCIVIPYVGSKLGELAIFENDFTCHLASNVAKVELTDDVIELDYLYYYLKSGYGQSQLFKDKQGSAQPNITMESIRETNVIVFDIPVQKKIASVLSSLDSKIEINNRINAELEAMAKTLYDYWFVQFDFPDAQGRPYKSSGGKMVWSGELKREVPEGWGVMGLFTAMDVQYGFPFSTTKFTDEVTDKPVIRIRDILQNTVSTYTTEDVDKKYRLQQNDLLIGMDGNFHLNFWDKDGAYLNQRSVRVRSRKDSQISNLQAYFELAPHIKAREKNISRTTVGHLSDKDLKRLLLVFPKSSSSFKPKFLFDSILSEITSNRLQNQKLAELRDWLLPMLMNGQVRVG